MNLENDFKKYKVKELSKKELVESVIKYAYSRVQLDKYIEAGDFIVEFIPKIDSIIDKYDQSLASFNHYINRHIKWFMFTFNKRYVQNKNKQEAVRYFSEYEYNSKEASLSTFEHATEYSIDPNFFKILSIKDGIITKESTRRRVEIFILKNARSVNYEQLQVFAPLISRTTDWLFEKKEELCRLCEKRVNNRKYLQQRSNRLYMEITKMQEKYSKCISYYEKSQLLVSIEKLKNRKSTLDELIKQRQCGPKNEEIANLLNIPKGTVDSSLFYLKKALESLLPNLNIN